jgi:hypothetical protein
MEKVINYICHISEEILKNVDRQIKLLVGAILWRPSAKKYFPVNFKVIAITFLFTSQ